MAVKANATAMVLIATTLWGFIGVPVRGMSEAGLDSVQINGARTVVTAILLLVLLLIADRSLFRIRREELPFMIVAAVMKLLMDICYVQAQVTLSLSLAAVLLSTGCYFTIFLSFFLFRSSLTWKKIAASVIGFSGCALMVGVLSGDIGDIDTVGVLIGLGAALAGAFYSVSMKMGLDRGSHPTSVLFYVFLFGSFMILPFMDPVGTFSTVSSGLDTFGILMLLAVMFTLVPYYCYTKGLKDLDPTTVNILLFTETAMAAVAGMLVYGEMLTFIDIVGLAMILLSVSMVDRRDGEVRTPR